MKRIALAALVVLVSYSAQAQQAVKGIKRDDKNTEANTTASTKNTPHVAQPGDVRVNNTNAAKPVYKHPKAVAVKRNDTSKPASAIKVKPSPRPDAKHKKGKHGHGKKHHKKQMGPHKNVPVTAKGCNNNIKR